MLDDQEQLFPFTFHFYKRHTHRYTFPPLHFDHLFTIYSACCSSEMTICTKTVIRLVGNPGAYYSRSFNLATGKRTIKQYMAKDILFLTDFLMDSAYAEVC